MRTKSNAALALLGLVLAGAPCSDAQELPSPERIQEVRAYIKQAWTTLTRSVRDLPAAAPDPKLKAHRGAWPVYLSAREDRTRVEAELARQLDAAGRRQIELRTLPADPSAIREHGLLYLPKPYVVPGGRFNEMYGWDSYFIQVGLLRDGELARAKDMTENFLYEVEHYGTVLNANRTYYLTPLAAALPHADDPRRLREDAGPGVAALHAARDRDALPRSGRASPTSFPRPASRATTTSASGPAPEVLADEVDERGPHPLRPRARVLPHARGHRLRPRALLRARRATASPTSSTRATGRCGSPASIPRTASARSASTSSTTSPVCLNVLLYQMEEDTAAITRMLGDAARRAAWTGRGPSSAASAIDRYLWDPEAGLYFDYDFKTRRAAATTSSPPPSTRSGRASPPPEQAARVREEPPAVRSAGRPAHQHAGDRQPVGRSLRLGAAAADGGRGPAPLRAIGEDADRIARKFVALVAKEFARARHDRREVRRACAASPTCPRASASATARNQVGFGWTNAAFLELLAELEGK